MSATEYLPVCDEDNHVVGRARRDVIHTQELLHRAAHILVFNPRGELFLQRRGPDKDTFPGVWDSSVGGHVGLGETPEQTARREMLEEISLGGDPTPVGELGATESTGWEFVSVFELVTDQSPRWDGVEITDGQWLTPTAVEERLASGALETAPCFHEVFRLWASRHTTPTEKSETE